MLRVRVRKANCVGCGRELLTSTVGNFNALCRDYQHPVASSARQDIHSGRRGDRSFMPGLLLAQAAGGEDRTLVHDASERHDVVYLRAEHLFSNSAYDPVGTRQMRNSQHRVQPILVASASQVAFQSSVNSYGGSRPLSLAAATSFDGLVSARPHDAPGAELRGDGGRLEQSRRKMR